ncbi:MAG TPA: type II toxin-antitoxin system ParD family antitoxin [Candidatus Acidoferrales bacterium]|nr:type II toxin-antitoxin system ParD family antitoxin [Candidatus Acidoferrales bacterium]
MNVNLGPTLDKFVVEMLRSGLYQSQSEILREALRLLKEREQAKKAALARLRKEIAIGTQQAERSELLDASEVFARIREKSKQRKRLRA